MEHSYGETFVQIGLCMVAYSFAGPGFPLLALGAVLMAYGGALQSSRKR